LAQVVLQRGSCHPSASPRPLPLGAMARHVLCAVVALAPLAVQAGLTSFGSGTACRSSTNTADHCSETDTVNCRDKYDVLIQMTLADCMMVCNTIPATCKGIEFRGSDGPNRCEVWKVPILDTVSNGDFTCYEQTDNETEDGMLYLEFDMEMSTLNFTQVAATPGVESGLTEALKLAIVSAFDTTSAPSAVSGVTASQIIAYLDEAEELVKVGITPAANQNPLVMYAVLRPSNSDFLDGTNSIASGLLSSINTALQQIPNYQDFLNAGETSVSVQIKSYSRMLTNTPPAVPTPAPTPAPRPPPPGATPAPRYTSRADGAGPALLTSVGAVVIALYAAV